MREATCETCFGRMIAGECRNCGWKNPEYVAPVELEELAPAEVEARERRRVGYHVIYRKLRSREEQARAPQAGDFVDWTPTLSIVLFGIHPLVWAAASEKSTKSGKIGAVACVSSWVELSSWREFDDADGAIYEAVSKQSGFEWEEAPEPDGEEVAADAE